MKRFGAETWRHLAAANCESGPEEKLPRRLERYTFIGTLPDCLPDIKYEFSRVEDDRKAVGD